MKNTQRTALYLFMLAVITITSCVPARKYEDLIERRQNCEEQNKQLRVENEELIAENNEFVRSLGNLQERIEQEMADIRTRLDEGAFYIAFVNSDTLMAHYKLAIKMRKDFEQEQRRLENDLQRRQRSFQSEVETFQRQIQAGSISMDNAQVKEQELMQLQQELMQLNETYSSRLMTKELEMNIELYQKITDLLTRFNNEMGYDYILGFSPGGGILYAKEKHDVTQKVLEKLNEEYDAQ